jgi:cysteine-rich secretory family protein
MAPFSLAEQAAIVDAHNKYRTAVGTTPPLSSLVWSDELANNAQRHADTLVSTEPWTWARDLYNPHSGAHHPSRPGEKLGENIAAGTYTVTRLIDDWGKEEANFKIGGIFPDVYISPTGGEVKHYTQMVWRDTTEVGCGLVTTTGIDPTTRQPWVILVAQYYKSGNIEGEPVY